MATRVRDFLRVHKTDVVGEGLGLAKLEELVQRADVLVAKQRAGIAAARSATMQRQGIRDTLQTALLKYLKAVSVVAAKENTDLLAQFQLRRDHMGATADLKAIEAEINEQVRVLDGLMQYRFRGNAELMGEWAGVRNVLGSFRSQSQPASGGGASQPPSEGGSQTPKAA